MRHVIRYTLLTLICLGLVLTLLTGLVLGTLQYRVHANLQRYEDRPKVTGLPADWPGNRDFQPYQGPHPSQMETPADPVSYPLPLGSVGPVAPLRAGPNTYPLLCTIESSWLGQPVVDNQEGAGMAVYAEDANGKPTPEVIGYSKDCLFRSRAWYFYKRAGTDEFHPLEDAHDDIERITLNGEETDFVVRVEMGTINRYLYLVAALRGPQETDIAKPDPGHWNGRLIYRLRGGVGIGRRQGRIHPMGMLRDRAAELALGYAMVYSTANQTSNHYDIWLAADTAQRVKRQFTALYGQPRYTVGIGGSGGGLEQYLFAQNHPGLLDALIPLYSYPDMITQTIYTLDCELLEYYFDVTDGANPRWHDWGNRRWIQGLNTLSRA
ncbi:MAG: DUF6351 family protein, partial [Gammaproteobacteria bacterium]|nr:DUF6351 family protein [Gammaproteobacteria bacterium]